MTKKLNVATLKTVTFLTYMETSVANNYEYAYQLCKLVDPLLLI